MEREMNFYFESSIGQQGAIEAETSSETVFDRAQESCRTMERLKGSAWNVVSASDGIPDGWMRWLLEDARAFVFDPTKIHARSIFPESVASFAADGFTHVGDHHGQDIVAAPRLQELNFQRIEGVDVVEQKNGKQYLMVGSLRVDLQTVDLKEHGISGESQKWVEVSIARTGASQRSGDYKKRNPDLAQTSIFSDLRKAALQLQQLGYTNVMCAPTDERRRRIYERIGFQLLPDSNTLFASLDDLLR